MLGATSGEQSFIRTVHSTVHVYHGIKETIGSNGGRRYVSVTYLHRARNSFSSNVFRATGLAPRGGKKGRGKKFITEIRIH